MEFSPTEASVSNYTQAKYDREVQLGRIGLNQFYSGHCPAFAKAALMAQKAARSAAHVVIFGESGSGKELFAKFIHNESQHKKGPFVAINCSAIPENLLESELFGHAKGSFTGASERKIGLFEEAQNGTLFLDEIGDLSLSLQAKLLRVLQEKSIRRVGENMQRPINCRIISATHKNLAEEVDLGSFREDLFFRLNVIPIQIPALRDRPEDILDLAKLFLKKFSDDNRASGPKKFSDEALSFIRSNIWRGNVRELENSIERAVVLCAGEVIELSDMASTHTSIKEHKGTGSQLYPSVFTFKVNCEEKLVLLEQIVNQYITFALGVNQGAKDKTARDLGIDRKTLYKRIKPHFEISEPAS